MIKINTPGTHSMTRVHQARIRYELFYYTTKEK
mgnify:FL=1